MFEFLKKLFGFGKEETPPQPPEVKVEAPTVSEFPFPTQRPEEKPAPVAAAKPAAKKPATKKPATKKVNKKKQG